MRHASALSSVRVLRQYKKKASGVHNIAGTLGHPVLSGDNAAHADGLHLPPWFCDCRVSWHAYRVARAPSFHLLLAHLPTSRAPGTKNVGRDGPVDACYHHRLALWTLAQSRV